MDRLVIFATIYLTSSLCGESEEDGNVEKSVSVLHSVITRSGWTDVIIVSNYEQVLVPLLKMLHHSYIKTIIVRSNEIHHYNWPQFEFKRHGYLLIIERSIDFFEVSSVIKNELHLISVSRKWILFCDQSYDLQKLVSLLTEGDKLVTVVREDNSNSAFGKQNDLACKQEYEGFFLLYLHSPGDGTFSFQCVINEIFPLPSYNFRSRMLKITSLGSFPVRQRPSGDNPRWSGYIFDVINILADSLNFSYTAEDQKDRIYGVEQNGSWNGMIGELVTGKADLAAADLSWSPDRVKVVDFTFPIFPEYVTFAYQAPQALSRAWILFDIYDSEVWVCIIFACFLVALTSFISLYLNHWPSQDKLKGFTVAGRSLNYAFTTLVGKGTATLPKIDSLRIVIGIWSLVAVIFTAVYSGNLTSSLSFHKTELPIDDLYELTKRYPQFQLIVKEGSYLSFMNHSLFYSEVDFHFHTISANTTPDDVMELVRKYPYVWVAERAVLERKMKEISKENDICDVYVSKDAIRRSDWALALPKNSAFLTQFNHRIIQMHKFGLIESLIQHYWSNSNATCSPTDGNNKKEEEEIIIRVRDITAVLLLLITGQLFAIFIFSIETCCSEQRSTLL